MVRGTPAALALLGGVAAMLASGPAMAEPSAEPGRPTTTAVEPGPDAAEPPSTTSQPSTSAEPESGPGSGSEPNDSNEPAADATTSEPAADRDGATPSEPESTPKPSTPTSTEPSTKPSEPASSDRDGKPPSKPEPSSTRRYGKGPEESAEDNPSRLIRVGRRRPRPSIGGRSSSSVTREELDQRLPRSAPDALQGEPGVYLQQTAHGQGSPYVRGLTGQHTVIIYDGIRLNNSTFRQGPNQYFFTIDTRSIEKLEVIRGSASTRFGSDALGGALLVTPVQPAMDGPKGKWIVHPRMITRFNSADAQKGGAAQVELHRGTVGVLVGAGYRDVGQLRSGGRVIAPATGQTQKVPPAFEDDDKTQRGTGFEELTSGVRLQWWPRDKHRFTLAYDDYRQFNVPRTDKCPPPTAPEDECLRYLRQFRTLAYAAYDGINLHPAAETIRATLSYNNQHERRQLRRGSPSFTEVHGEDDVHTAGVGLRIATKDFELAPWVSLQGRYGTDAYLDVIGSEGWLLFNDVGVRSDLTRGQYLNGGRYLTSGLWADAVATFWDVVRLRAGGRGALALARADGDEATSSAPVDRTWGAAVGNAGLSVDAVPWLTFHTSLDQGFRAPNMDDLTSRQQTGPGFQFENPDLAPERSLSIEAGATIDHPWVELHTSVFQTRIRDLIARAPRTAEECPMGEVGCGASQTRFQLVNLDGFALIRGVEADLRVYLPLDLRARGVISYAIGNGPNPVFATSPDQPAELPLSRIPPLNGLAELGWQGGRTGLWTTAALRWARAQTRLALADQSDARIPEGGTPGYVVVDLRAGYRLDPYMLIAVAFENVADTAYRNHGSSINGPGRGLSLQLEFGF